MCGMARGKTAITSVIVSVLVLAGCTAAYEASAPVITKETEQEVRSAAPFQTPNSTEIDGNYNEGASAPDRMAGEDKTTERTTSPSTSTTNRTPQSADRPLTAQPAPVAPETSPSPSAPPAAPAAPAPEPAPTITTPACPGMPGGSVPAANGANGQGNITGTTTGDLQSFATKYNSIRVANCLPPVPFSNFRYDSCMEQRLIWMAEDPSTDPMSAWGHIGSQRSDGVPSVGCDGNLAGGSGNTGATVAQKWWDSSGHRSSLYKPTYTGSTSNVCILFAMTHGGVPNEPSSFVRSAARWVNC